MKALLLLAEAPVAARGRIEEVEPELGRVIDATPPWIEDPLRR